MQKKIIVFFSQWKVIVPLGLVVLIWFFWPQPKTVMQQKQPTTQNSTFLNEVPKQEVSITSIFGVNKKLRCEIQSATAYIDDERITAILTANKKESRVTFDGDCLYRWTSGNSNGERSCGLKKYLPLASKFVSNDSLEKLFPQTKELTSSCKEVSIVDQKVFEIPKTVLFKNKKLF